MMKVPTKDEIKKLIVDGLKDRGIDVPSGSNAAQIINDLVDRTDMFGGDFYYPILPVGFDPSKLNDAFDPGIIGDEPVPVCECGAKHTDFPDNHYDFCPLAVKNA